MNRFTLREATEVGDEKDEPQEHGFSYFGHASLGAAAGRAVVHLVRVFIQAYEETLRKWCDI